MGIWKVLAKGARKWNSDVLLEHVDNPSFDINQQHDLFETGIAHIILWLFLLPIFRPATEK